MTKPKMKAMRIINIRTRAIYFLALAIVVFLSGKSMHAQVGIQICDVSTEGQVCEELSSDFNCKKEV